MNVTKIISIVLLVLSLGLGYYLISSVKSTIDDQAMIAERESAVIEKLMLIREAEEVYLEVNGNYTSDWDKLIDFIENGKYPIIQKKERVVTLSYGADSSIITYDTLDIIPAKDRIFKELHNVNAANTGTFVSFAVEPGEEAIKGAPAYTLVQNGKNVTHKFKESGRVKSRKRFTPGQEIIKGDLMMSLEETKYDQSIDISKLAYVPGYEFSEEVKFDIFAAEIERSNTMVDVVEVKNPKPFDPTRSENNEAKNKKPLRFGSKTDVTLSGNWE
ncbi:MAG: hypothetical protein RIB54_04230 [Fulvivirga sp.]|jgi:hypothetical protein|uniref:hypothetical protein n=1 Tax=Fulvivirga sp. TaxID=1931237 RepID=UPI0032EA98F5